MSNTANTQSGTIQQTAQPTQQMMIPADYVLIALIAFAIGIRLGSKLTNNGAKSANRIVEMVRPNLV